MARVVGLHIKPEGAARLPKRAVDSIIVEPAGVRGDYNHYRHVRKRDTPDRAVLLLPREVLVALNDEGWPVKPGDLGENVLVQGLAYGDLRPGSRLSLGAVVVELTEEARPCRNLLKLPYGTRSLITALKGRRGWFAKVLMPGVVRVGEGITLA